MEQPGGHSCPPTLRRDVGIMEISRRLFAWPGLLALATLRLVVGTVLEGLYAHGAAECAPVVRSRSPAESTTQADNPGAPGRQGATVAIPVLPHDLDPRHGHWIFVHKQDDARSRQPCAVPRADAPGDKEAWSSGFRHYASVVELARQTEGIVTIVVCR